ncbi:hypothetical protein CAPTEDRAFT_229169 [Capitella teleta]|uniref:EGF-like domain-containing protein n=1 Tax=Capitella teleta TaxID=283909 RepID=R7V248_CAPTE|nr:hypothetical protein CAPTEDRAFT_229169 [Capitella teleta]|eukprot:ELU09761.1 hypothetical protein CAPTEDRAFT_229169 [Capitella teleta]
MTLPHIPVCICPPEFSGELCEHMPVSHNMWAYVIGIPVVMVSVVLIFVAAAVVYYFRTTWKGRGEAYDPAPTSALRTMVAAGGNNSRATGAHRVSYVEDRANILAAEELG